MLEAMETFRDPGIITGFCYERPLKGLPSLTHCGEAQCARDHSLKWHQHRGFEFLYLSRGDYSWQVGRQTFHQGMGDIFVAYPGESHRSASRSHPETHHLWIGLCLDGLGAEGARLARQLRASRPRLLGHCHETEPILRGIVCQVTGRQSRRNETVQAYLRVLISLIEQRLASGMKPSSAAEDVPYSYPIQKAVGYMRENLDRRLPVQDVARVAGCGISQFCARFGREVGLSPAAYHLQLRLNAAREALGQRDSSIQMVAMEYGFSSSQHFSAVFGRAFKITPRQCQMLVPS
jgi:AraC-like DNA-binding protein